MTFNKANQMEIEAVLHVFSRLDIENEEDISKFNVGILDVYSYTLSEVEAKDLLSSFAEHNLKYEDRFIDTISSIFRKNGGIVLVYLSQCNYDSDLAHKKGVKCKFSKENENELIKIDNLADLEIIAELSTRELFFSNFFFMNINTAIIANYDLSFPVYCDNQQDFNWLTNEAIKNGLFIRK
ncbi:hypothetical protein ACFSTH_09445 [Paenibacillus yanchengensis]|uniref:Uncharacterized protein n=1 Tax=Paenibacillus yanchengensis TaxID=2035833 RepID=A0ABW4YPV4_9BACL